MLAAIPAILLSVSHAAADSAAATACAERLPKDSKAIYDSTRPQVVPGANLRDLVTASTRQLVSSGAISMGGARGAAVAAGECLRLIAN